MWISVRRAANLRRRIVLAAVVMAGGCAHSRESYYPRDTEPKLNRSITDPDTSKARASTDDSDQELAEELEIKTEGRK